MVARKTLMGAIPMVVAAITQGANVRVVWGDFGTASSDGKVIRMPLLPLEDSKVEAYALGYAVHETGHIVGSDFSIGRQPGLHGALVNILEDVRIEGERINALPGARRWLEDLAHVLLEDGRIACARVDDEVADKLCSYLLTNLWVQILGFGGLREAARKCRDMLAQSLPVPVFTQVETLALGVATAVSTRDVADIADAIMALLREQQQAHQQQAQDQATGPGETQSGSGLPADNAQDAQSAGPRGDAPPDDSTSKDGVTSGGHEPTGDGSPDAGRKAAGARPDCDVQPDVQDASVSSDGGKLQRELSDDEVVGQGQERSGVGQGVDDGYSMTAQQAAQAIQAVLEATTVKAGMDISHHIADGLRGALGDEARNGGNSGRQRMKPPEIKDIESVRSVSALIGQVRNQSMALRARLDEYVQARAMGRTSRSRSGCRMTRDAATRMAMGDYRVFVRRTEGMKVDTGIVLLVDCSSSMSRDNRIGVARQSAMVLAVALEDIRGTQLSVMGFGASKLVSRVMRFGESIRRTAGRIDKLTSSGTTPMAEGLMVAHGELLRLDTERRIVMVISDGDPDDKSAVADLVDFGNRHGIEHMGIGIGSQTDHLFPVGCTINQIGQLPRAVLEMAQGALFKNQIRFAA